MPRPKADRPTYSLTQRGDFFYVQWWESGRAHRVSCRTADKSQARRFLAEFKAGIDEKPIPASPAIGAILDAYAEDRGKRPHSPTLQYCVDALKRHIGDLPVALLTKEQVQRYVTERRDVGAAGASAQYRKKVRALSDGTLIRELGVLRRALAWAVDERWIATAPRVERPSAPPSRERWLTEEEAQKLLDAAKTPHVKVFIALALWTAGRTGALLQLTWDRVDLDRGIVNLGSGSGRKRRATVPIVDDLRPILVEAREAATTPFVVEFGGRPLASVKTAFRRAAERAALPGVTAHICRHTAATWMVQKGTPTAMVARFLGNTEAMVEKVYGHHSPDYLKQAAAALSMKSSPA